MSTTVSSEFWFVPGGGGCILLNVPKGSQKSPGALFGFCCGAPMYYSTQRIVLDCNVIMKNVALCECEHTAAPNPNRNIYNNVRYGYPHQMLPQWNAVDYVVDLCANLL